MIEMSLIKSVLQIYDDSSANYAIQSYNNRCRKWHVTFLYIY